MQKRIAIVSCLLSLFLIASVGCSNTSLFKVLTSEPHLSDRDQLQKKFDYAKSPSDYASCRTQAQQLYDAATTTADRNYYQIQISKAVMGENQVTITDLLPKIGDVGENSTKNMIEILGEAIGDDVSSADLRQAALGYNSVSSASLSTDQNLLKGELNTIVVSQMINTYFCVTNSGNDTVVATKDSDLSVATQIENLMNPDGNLETNDSVTSFALAAQEGFEGTTMESKQKNMFDDLKKLSTYSNSLDDLYGAMNGTTGNYTYSSGGQAKTISTTQQSDAELIDALEYIFNQ